MLHGYIGAGGFLAGAVFGAWVYAGQVAKRDLKIQELSHAQEVVDLRGQLTAASQQLKLIEDAGEEAAGDRQQQTWQYVQGSRQLAQENEDLRAQLDQERKPYYEIELPKSTIDRVNCAFHPSMCLGAEASGAEDYNGDEGGEDQHLRNLVGASPSGQPSEAVAGGGYYPQSGG